MRSSNTGGCWDNPLTNFVELISLVLVELWREVGAEGHDEEGDAEQGVHQVEHREEPEGMKL